MHVILIPGLWLVGSSWDDVVPALEEAGHEVLPLTPPGMGSRRLDRSHITLRDHVEDVVEVIDSLLADAGEGAKVILVAHGSGGAVAHAAVDARPDKVARVIYVSAVPRGDGEHGEDWDSVNGEVPLPNWADFGDDMLVDLDEELRERIRARSIPSPEAVMRDPQKLENDARYDVPVTVVACEESSDKIEHWILEGNPRYAELGKITDVSYLDLATGHWPQYSKPAELGRLLVESIA